MHQSVWILHSTSHMDSNSTWTYRLTCPKQIRLALAQQFCVRSSIAIKDYQRHLLSSKAGSWNSSSTYFNFGWDKTKCEHRLCSEGCVHPKSPWKTMFRLEATSNGLWSIGSSGHIKMRCSIIHLAFLPDRLPSQPIFTSARRVVMEIPWRKNEIV